MYKIFKVYYLNIKRDSYAPIKASSCGNSFTLGLKWDTFFANLNNNSKQ